MKPVIPPPVTTLLFAAAMWGVSKTSMAMHILVPARFMLVGALIVAAAVVAAAAIGLFRKHETTVHPLQPESASALVTDGIYRVTRNPMYLGLALLLAAWMVWLGRAANLLLFIGFLVAMTELQIKPEERALNELFGDRYREYRRRVRRWL
jgi:protein-S-isoprenylcysteine O-methyltransferase Ste14